MCDHFFVAKIIVLCCSFWFFVGTGYYGVFVFVYLYLQEFGREGVAGGGI